MSSSLPDPMECDEGWFSIRKRVMIRPMHGRIFGTVGVLALIFAGCGGSDSSSSGGGGAGAGGTGAGTSGGGTSSGGTSSGGTSSGGTAGTATGGSAGTASGGSAGTATGGSAGTAAGGSAGSGGKPNLDAGTGGKPGDAGTGCVTPSDCKTFSSYCSTAPCQCLALGVNEKNPPCTGQQVACTVDPCAAKSATCVSGKCVISSVGGT